MVESQLPKLLVGGSIPLSRSIFVSKAPELAITSRLLIAVILLADPATFINPL